MWGAAVVERVQRALGGLIDRQQSMLQPVAEEVGTGIRVRNPEGTPESWSITMFTEEVVRGGMAFAVSGVMRKLEAEIRKAGGLSDWQIVSPGTKTASGLLCNVVLKDVQEVQYPAPTVLFATHITGEEEIPVGVIAIITPDAVDVLSHVAVRARQLKVLFATCFDAAALASISALAHTSVSCSIGTQFTCFTGTKVQMLTPDSCVSCSSRRLPARRARRLRSSATLFHTRRRRSCCSCSCCCCWRRSAEKVPGGCR